MKFENVKGIVWDLDGTLLDSFGIFEQVISDVVQESGHAMPTQHEILRSYHGSLEETVQRLLGIDSAEELDQTITTFLAKQERHYAGDLEAHLFSDATGLAQQAARQAIHQMIVTNRAHAERGSASPKFIVAATVLADCIHEVRSSDEVEYRKPDSRSLGDWMGRHRLTSDEVIVIGDQFVDAQLALNIDARAILIRRNGEVPHLEMLSEQNHKDIVIVDTLDAVELI